MNPHRIIEVRPRDWITCTLVVFGECCVFVAIGYFARPILERVL